MFEDTIVQEKWKKLSFEIKADKPYSYLTVGNFKEIKNQNTNTYT